MKNIAWCFALAALAVSCKKELEVQEPMYTSKDTTTGRAATAATPVNTQQVQSPQQSQQVQVAPQQLEQAQKTAPGMNPPHGQPGHRCEIAVGAPLNSAPAAKPAPAKTGSATVTQVNPAAGKISSQVKTAPGMNPPHGERGHRCDIAVGAPLSSAPPKTETAPAQAVPAVLAAPVEETKE